MAKKFIDYLVWGVIILVCIGIMWLLIDPLRKNNEIIFYFRLFLLMFAVNTFAILRLYNSIVQNTRFSIKLRENFIKMQRVIPVLERSIKTLSTFLGNVKVANDSLRKSVDGNSDKIEKLTEKINKIK